MSTTSNPAVAIAYGQSRHSLLFKIISKSFMTRGADISYLSAFPGEREYLFPPLTFLQPTGRPTETIHVDPLVRLRSAKPTLLLPPNPSSSYDV